MIPGKYPLRADSYLLRNQDGEFEDITDQQAPELMALGMVTDALWSDFDMDSDLDLIAVGEWMPVTVFRNDDGEFQKISNEDNGLKFSSGWWWSIASDDFDNDGDQDFVVGNMGHNYKFGAASDTPLEIFAFDFDTNNSLDIAMGYHQNGKLFPVSDKMKTIRQNPSLRDKIPTNNDYALATLDDIYGKEILENSTHYKIHTLATSYIINLGNGKFEIMPMDSRAQISNVNSILVHDIDLDGNKDLVMAGNLYSTETETIRNDGGIGLWLRGNGEGIFQAIPSSESGLYIPGDVRHLGIVQTRNSSLLMCVKNDDYLQSIKVLPILD